MRKQPILYIVIPCYNEEKVLPITSGMFLEKINTPGSGRQDQPRKPGVVCERRLEGQHLEHHHRAGSEG